MTQRVAILGLGTMGMGMATNLLTAGIPTTVWNRTRSKAEPLAAAGARIAATPADAARDADIILTMLADETASRAAWLGENGALAAANPPPSSSNPAPSPPSGSPNSPPQPPNTTSASSTPPSPAAACRPTPASSASSSAATPPRSKKPAPSSPP
jgi:hypothetical protein